MWHSRLSQRYCCRAMYCAMQGPVSEWVAPAFPKIVAPNFAGSHNPRKVESYMTLILQTKKTTILQNVWNYSPNNTAPHPPVLTSSLSKHCARDSFFNTVKTSVCVVWRLWQRKGLLLPHSVVRSAAVYGLALTCRMRMLAANLSGLLERNVRQKQRLLKRLLHSNPFTVVYPSSARPDT